MIRLDKAIKLLKDIEMFADDAKIVSGKAKEARALIVEHQAGVNKRRVRKRVAAMERKHGQKL